MNADLFIPLPSAPPPGVCARAEFSQVPSPQAPRHLPIPSHPRDDAQGGHRVERAQDHGLIPAGQRRVQRVDGQLRAEPGCASGSLVGTPASG